MAAPVDRSGTELEVGDSVIIRGHVKTINSATEIVVETDEIDYPTSTTAFKDLTVNSRLVEHD